MTPSHRIGEMMAEALKYAAASHPNAYTEGVVRGLSMAICFEVNDGRISHLASTWIERVIVGMATETGKVDRVPAAVVRRFMRDFRVARRAEGGWS